MLFSPLSLRGVTLRNRIGVSPMCQYSSADGFADDWHLVHLGAFAVGGAALVMVEATAVTPEGRISPQDMGIWHDDHVEGLGRLARFIRNQGAVPAIQLAHAGRKGSTRRPWEGGGGVPPGEGGWQVVGPSALRFSPASPEPRTMQADDIAEVVRAFGDAARRALAAGFQVVEVHAAHGYLLHQFLSPLSNRRDDEFGGTVGNRTRFPQAVIDAVRAQWPDGLPLFVRLSATDWAPGGWDVGECVDFARSLASRGVDLVDTSSGGLVPGVSIPFGPGYNVPFARRIREGAGIATGAVGQITTPALAEHIISDGDADLVFMARELLRQPRWPLLAAHELGVDVAWPPQYERARPSR